MKLIWNRIEAWLAANAPEVRLNPSATPDQVAQAELILKISFPPALRDTLSIHNGQAADGPWLLEGWEFLSLERIVDEWTVWKELLDGGDFEDSQSDSDGRTLTDWWHPLWIPLTYDGAGNHHCLDLAPGPRGVAGQIIQMWHDEPARDLIAPSYEAWLRQFAAGLEAGDYEFSDELGGIVERGA